MKIKKIFNKIEFSIMKKTIYFSDKLYMNLVTKYYKKIGIVIEGTPKFIANDVYFDGTDYSRIKIKNNITISREVMFLTHDYSITTANATIGNYIERGKGELFFLKEIVIGENCFIGARASILPGTTIGDNVIVGACTVVRGNVPSNVIIIGNPWKIVGSTSNFALKHNNAKDYLIERKTYDKRTSGR